MLQFLLNTIKISHVGENITRINIRKFKFVYMYVHRSQRAVLIFLNNRIEKLFVFMSPTTC